MRRKPFHLFVLLACTLALGASQTDNYAILSWHDSVRDIYIDNELDRSAQFLITENPSRAALVSSKLDKAIILDINAHTLFSTPKEAFKFSDDRTEATSSSPFTSIGRFTPVDGPVYSFAVDGKPVLIRSHPGYTGKMSLQTLFETVPVWKALMERYQPQAASVAALKQEERDTNVTLLFGTWCGDSRYYIPKLLKTLSVADNKRLHVTLIGIDNQFREPVDTVQPRALTNVPTVIVERDGREIGRIVETPATTTFEEDLAAILAGKPGVHNGRWDRGALLAKGIYAYRDQKGKECGKESWELFNGSEGGFFIHSRITVATLSTEVYQRIDAGGHPAFAEITKILGENRTRIRISIDGKTLTARVRGSSSGVVTQTLGLPPDFFLSSPAIVTQAWSQPPEASGKSQTTAYLVPTEFEETTGGLARAECETKGAEKVRVPAGEFQAKHFVRTEGRETSEWWVHPSLGIPVKGRIGGGLEFVLISLEAQHNG
jgi:thiol-disulfide isomerase/thioredoxin